MPEIQPRETQSLLARRGHPLIGVMIAEDDRETTRYFADEDEANDALAKDSIQKALSLAGAWQDMDWAEAEADLDRIRHESQPTPPIEL